MKVFHFLPAFFLLLSHFIGAQPPEYNQKFGIRFSAGRGGYVGLGPQYYPAYTIGLQYLKKLPHPNLALSSGLNLTSVHIGTPGNTFSYRHLQLPAALRFEGRSLYLEGGIYGDYLII